MDRLQVFMAFPPDGNPTDKKFDEGIKNHIKRLEALFRDQTPYLLENAAELLQAINPAIYTVSYLALINMCKNNDHPDISPVSRTTLTKYILQFLEVYDPRQIRYVGDTFSQFIDEILACRWISGPQAVGVVTNALLRLDPAVEMLTTARCNLASLAFESGHATPALPIIEKPYVYVPNMANQGHCAYLCQRDAAPCFYISRRTGLTDELTRNNVMAYDYVCGSMLAGLSKWAEAHAAFGRIVAFPTKDGSVTQTMADAYKKFIITGLLATGQLPQLSASIHPTAVKNYAVAGKPYIDLANIFPTTNVEQLGSEAEKSVKVWEDDGTTGLVQQILKGYQIWQIASLSNVYSKMSISEVREQTKSAETGQGLETDEEVEAIVESMISSGMLQGVLVHQDDGTKCLTFFPPGQELSEEVFAAKIKESVERLKVLGRVVETTNLRLTMSKDYAKHLFREQKRLDKDDAHTDPGFGFEESIEDEDLMTDVSQQF